MRQRKRLAVNGFTAVLTLLVLSVRTQNNVNLQMEDGSPFVVLVNDEWINKTAQSHVTLHDVTKDTLLVKIGLEGGVRYGVTLYLLDKGEHTKEKEFTYLIRRQKNRLQPVFMGMRGR